MRSVFVLLRSAGERQAGDADVTFAPDMSGTWIGDMGQAEEILERAAVQVEPMLDTLERRYRAFCGQATQHR